MLADCSVRKAAAICNSAGKGAGYQQFFHVIITVYVIIKVERNDSGTSAFRGMRFRNQTLIYRIF